MSDHSVNVVVIVSHALLMRCQSEVILIPQKKTILKMTTAFVIILINFNIRFPSFSTILTWECVGM